MSKDILVTKASGNLAAFLPEKLKASLIRSGAGEAEAADIIKAVTAKLYTGISTKKIYQWAFKLLKGKSRHLAARYNLKSAIMALGPSGYPFEKYIAEVLRSEGYSALTGQIVKGNCVNHEIDVIAEKENQQFMVECKYHNTPGNICDVKIPLYIRARFLDVESVWSKTPGHEKKFYQGWVVTNTRFSLDAIQYGICVGLRLIGWNYPDGESLRSRIDKSGLYPVTCLTTLTKGQKQSLLEQGIVLAHQVCENERPLLAAGIKSSAIKAIQDEAHALCRKKLK